MVTSQQLYHAICPLSEIISSGIINSMILKLIGGFFLDIIETVVIALSIFLIVYLFIMQPHQVNGNSMMPNFKDGEYLMTDKISYLRGQPKRGDVIVFHSPPEANCPSGTNCDFIKRVIGLPGETVEIRDSSIYIDGQKLDKPYLPADTVTISGQFTSTGLLTIPQNQYFVMGDNRSHSSDSRAWGFITKEEIVGKAFFRYFPFSRLGLLSTVPSNP